MAIVLLTAQRSCRTHFNIPRHGSVACRKAMEQTRKMLVSQGGDYKDVCLLACDTVLFGR
jgi:hypothetical protein